jgi:2,3-bisphosphoglycerate-independent phosphoglycerate mutase
MSKHTATTPLVLLILDGWGLAADGPDNAITQAQTPVWDRLWQQYPHSELAASGPAVGLPEGQMGNSEVGHIHLGAGRQCPQSLVKINAAIESGDFQQNKVWQDSLDHVAKHKKNLHVMGLLSPGGVHSHETHLLAALQMACQQHGIQCFFHAFLDGRDTPPRSAMPSIEKTHALIAKHPHMHFASITGRYYAMDRDQRWERTTKAFQCLCQTPKHHHASAMAALTDAYANGQSDEFVLPATIDHQAIADGDVVWMLNFRADRARQLCQALTAPAQTPCAPHGPHIHHCITLTDYGKDFQCTVAYPKPALDHTLGACIADAGLRQLRLAETEKYAHVTYFFNGGQETHFTGEQRALIASPKVATYDLQPEMSAMAITDTLLDHIKHDKTDVIIANFANADMVGHTGQQHATEKAIAYIDACLGRIVDAVLAVDGQCLITADHGNAEQMYNTKQQQTHTAHTLNPVPCLYVGQRVKTLKSGGLIDVAPTLLSLLHLPVPKEMTGNNLAIMT